MSTFSELVKLARDYKSQSDKIERLRAELRDAEAEGRRMSQAISDAHLFDTLANDVSTSTFNRLANLRITTYYRALALDDWNLPKGLGGKTRKELNEALAKRGLHIPNNGEAI